MNITHIEINSDNKNSQSKKIKIASKVSSIISSTTSDSEKTSKIINLISKTLKKQDLKELVKLESKLQSVSEELSEIKRKEELIQSRKLKRKNRKRLPKREAISETTYNFLINETEILNNRFLAARLRIALALLAVTGVLISELLQLKIKQVEPLFSKGYLVINKTDKVYLNSKGKEFLRDRVQDLELISRCKNENSYIFTAKDSEKPLARQNYTNSINKFIKECAEKMPNQPILSSYSFYIGIGFSSKLWSNPKEIRFIKETLGHKTRTKNSNQSIPKNFIL